jgi:hypothetical protein
MPRIFSVTHLFTFRDEEIPAQFTFDIPAKGDYFFIQDGEDVFMYIEGRTDDDTIKVEGLVISEGAAIPDDFETQTVLAALIEEELVWLTVVTKEPVRVPDVSKKPTVWDAWKKKF